MDKETITTLAKRNEPSVQADHPVIALPPHIQYQFISDAALKQHVYVCADKGAGKSRLLGRVFAWQYLIQGKPAVILDPTGGVIDNLFDKVLRLPPDRQEHLWQRLLYIDAGSKDWVFPSPLYYRLSEKDTLFEMANRLVAVLVRQDEYLQQAPILGKNALQQCAICAGKIAATIGRQIDFVSDLVEHPGRYKALLRQILTDQPALKSEIEYFRTLMDEHASGFRERKTGSFTSKLLPFTSDPVRMAKYAAHTNRLDWLKLLKKNIVVLIDYRHVHDEDHRQFDMIWHFRTFVDAIQQRGAAGRGKECLLIIDEVTDLLGPRSQDGNPILTEDFQKLISRYGRAYGANVVIANQGLYQVAKPLQELFLGMGNHIIGQLSSPDDAVRVARQFLRYNPHKVKKTEAVWATIHPPAILSYFTTSSAFQYPRVIDQRTVEYTPEEQILHWVNKILDLDRFQFLTQIATGEGGKKRSGKITIANLDRDQYPNEAVLAPLREALAKRDGIPLEQLLAELQANQVEAAPEKPTKRTGKSKTATMEENHDTPTPSTNPVSESDSISASGDGIAIDARAAISSPGSDFWEPVEEA